MPNPWGAEMDNARVTRETAGGDIGFRLSIDYLELNSTLDRVPIMGPSGAGKSTLLNLLAGVTFPNNPDALITWRFPDGYSCEWTTSGPAKSDLIKLRQKYFGYVFQSASLQPHLTVEENLSLGLLNTKMPPDVVRDKIRHAFRSVFDQDPETTEATLSRFGSELSGGERQRISLLASLVRDPYVLLADEPTGNLDTKTRSEVMEVLTRWLSERPGERMLIWVTHHDTDPAQTGSAKRLYVDAGTAQLQHDQNGKWEPVS